MSSPTPSQYIGYTVLVANIMSLIQASSTFKRRMSTITHPRTSRAIQRSWWLLEKKTAMAADTTRNKYTFAFDILVMQVRSDQSTDQNASYAAAENLMRVLVDDLTLRLNADITVGGLGSTFSRPVSHKWAYVKEQDVNTRICTIGIEVVVGQ